MGGEHERAEPVSESCFDESPERDLSPVARVELVCAPRHLADDLLDREQSRGLLEQEIEHAAGWVAHNITGHRNSK